jgi:hypothetical protein
MMDEYVVIRQEYGSADPSAVFGRFLSEQAAEKWAKESNELWYCVLPLKSVEAE